MKGDEPIFSRWSSSLVIITQPSCISQVFSFQSLISWKFSTLGMPLQMPLRIWFCCGFYPSRILHFFDPSVCPSLAWQLTFSPIYMHLYVGIYTMWIITGPIKPYRFWHQVITRPDQNTLPTLTNLAALTTLTDQKKDQDDQCRICIESFVLYSVISSSCCRYSLAQWKSYFNPRQKIIEGSPRYFDLGLRLSVTYCCPQIYFVSRGREGGFLVANLEEGYREGDIRSSKIGCKLSQQKKFLSHGSILSLLCQEITTNPQYGEAQKYLGEL